MHRTAVLGLGLSLAVLDVCAEPARRTSPKGSTASFETGTSWTFAKGAFATKPPEPLKFTITDVDLDGAVGAARHRRERQVGQPQDRARHQRQPLSRGRQRGLPQSDDDLRQGPDHGHVPRRALASFRCHRRSRSFAQYAGFVHGQVARPAASAVDGARDCAARRRCGRCVNPQRSRDGEWHDASPHQAVRRGRLHRGPRTTGRRSASPRRRRPARSARLFHTTFQTPKRQAELMDGGSLYWVIKGIIQVRQRLRRRSTRATRTTARAAACSCSMRALVPVRPAPRRAFQGWRYLSRRRRAARSWPRRQQLAALPPTCARTAARACARSWRTSV